MGEASVARRGAGVARSIILLALLLAGCGPREPAPVVSGNESPPPPAQVIVERGQTLSGIAQDYHVPMHVVAEANHLSPPYRILVGQALIIPGGGQPGSLGPSVAMATPPTPSTQAPIGAPLTPPEPASVQPIPLDRPPPASSAGPPAAAGPAGSGADPAGLGPGATDDRKPLFAERVSPGTHFIGGRRAGAPTFGCSRPNRLRRAAAGVPQRYLSLAGSGSCVRKLWRRPGRHPQ